VIFIEGMRERERQRDIGEIRGLTGHSILLQKERGDTQRKDTEGIKSKKTRKGENTFCCYYMYINRGADTNSSEQLID